MVVCSPLISNKVARGIYLLMNTKNIPWPLSEAEWVAKKLTCPVCGAPHMGLEDSAWSCPMLRINEGK